MNPTANMVPIEIIRGWKYDSISPAPASVLPTTVNLFVEPYGINRKTPADTNMMLAGSLPQPEAMTVRRIFCASPSHPKMPIWLDHHWLEFRLGNTIFAKLPLGTIWNGGDPLKAFEDRPKPEPAWPKDCEVKGNDPGPWVCFDASIWGRVPKVNPRDVRTFGIEQIELMEDGIQIPQGLNFGMELRSRESVTMPAYGATWMESGEPAVPLRLYFILDGLIMRPPRA